MTNEYPTNDHEVIQNPDGQDMVPINEEIQIDGEPFAEYPEETWYNTEHEINPLARTEDTNNSNMATYGLIGAAILLVVLVVYLRFRKK